MSATVLCFGEILLRLSSPNKELLLQSPRFDVHVGGAEANVAVSLSKLGHAAAMASTLAGIAARARMRRRVAPSRRADGRDPLLRRPHGSVFPDARRRASACRSALRPRRIRVRRGSADAYDWNALLAGCKLAACFRYHAGRQQFRRRSRDASDDCSPTTRREDFVRLQFSRAGLGRARAGSACGAAQTVRTGRPDLRRRARLRVHARRQGRRGLRSLQASAVHRVHEPRATERGRAAALGLLCGAGGTPTRPAPTLSTASSIASARATLSPPASCMA